MTRYNVHIYREMRLFFPSIEATAPEEAARLAADKPTYEADYTEDCEGENLAALIDVVGDDDYTESVTIDFEPERTRKAARQLLSALEYALEYLRANDDGEEDIAARIAAASAALAGATGLPPLDPGKPIVIEVRGGVVQEVLNVPSGLEYVIRDYDSQEDIADDGRPT